MQSNKISFLDFWIFNLFSDSNKFRLPIPIFQSIIKRKCLKDLLICNNMKYNYELRTSDKEI